MAGWLDHKYAALISSRLERFKDTGNGHYRFRCPFCGDSQKNKAKTRGYLLSSGDRLGYYCHKCGTSLSFPKFLQRLDESLYLQYRLDSLKEQGKEPGHYLREQASSSFMMMTGDDPLRLLETIDNLRPSHFARVYLKDRKIPPEFFPLFYYAPLFASFVNGLIPGKFSPFAPDEPRIIIPMRTRDGRVIGFQGRSLNADDDDDAGKEQPRYITIMLEPEVPRVFGLDRVDFNKTFYVLEGPFDSLFLNNSIAVCGSDLVRTLKKMQVDKKLAVICFDNEPRSEIMIRKMRAAIEEGYRLVIWPSDIKEKDINEMILGGRTSSEIMHLIDQNTHEGLKAELVLGSYTRHNI